MAGQEFEVLAQRIDGVAWALMHLTAHLERTGRLDGDSYCQSLVHQAESRENNGLPVSAFVLREMAERLEEARHARRSMGQPG